MKFFDLTCLLTIEVASKHKACFPPVYASSCFKHSNYYVFKCIFKGCERILINCKFFKWPSALIDCLWRRTRKFNYKSGKTSELVFIAPFMILKRLLVAFAFNIISHVLSCNMVSCIVWLSSLIAPHCFFPIKG